MRSARAGRPVSALATGLRDYRMDTISASDAKNQFSALLDKVQTEPVIISKHGRPVAVVMSASEFDAHVSFKAEIAGGTETPG